jgi:hypothetical protein
MKMLSFLVIVSLLLAANPLFAETVTVKPGQSLQKAADKLNPGDTLLLAEGIYYQSFKLSKSGTADKPITIKAKVPGKAIVTGAMKTTSKFEKVKGDIYKAPWIAGKWRGAGTGRVWVIAANRCLYNYKNSGELKNMRNTPLEGFYYSRQGDAMHIRLLGGADPNKAGVEISRPDARVLLDIVGQQHIAIEGLRFRAAPESAIRLGPSRDSEPCRHIAIRDCSFFGFYRAIAGRRARKDKQEFAPSDISIERCQFSNYPAYEWVRYGQLTGSDTWKAMYSSVMGGAGVFSGGRARRWKVTRCYINNCYDGIGVAAAVSRDPTLGNEYSYNLFHNCPDDSIEFDTMEYAGVRAHHNVFLDGFCMLGLSPVHGGGVTVDNNIVYVSPEYGLTWGVIFKFSNPWKPRPTTGMTIRNNSFVHTKCGVQWGANNSCKPYFKDNIVANNIIYARDWKSWGGLPVKFGLQVDKNNLCCGPSIAAGEDVPREIPCTNNISPFVKPGTDRRDAMAPSLPELALKGKLGAEKELSRVSFSLSADYVRTAIKKCGLNAAEYKDMHKNLGAVRPGAKWKFARPGPRWSVGESALFRPPLPPSLDPWWVGFADKPSEAKTVRVRLWSGKFNK